MHAYETMSEFFHKVFNTTVENVLSLRVFSGPNWMGQAVSLRRWSDATASVAFLCPNWNCVAAMSFSPRDMMPTRSDHVSK